MRKKLEGNGRLETSRIILPEHREQFLARNAQKNHHKRQHLHDDECETISGVIAQSMNSGEPATFLLCDPVQDYELTGVVMKIDQQIRRIKIQNGEECTWVPMDI